MTSLNIGCHVPALLAGESHRESAPAREPLASGHERILLANVPACSLVCSRSDSGASIGTTHASASQAPDRTGKTPYAMALPLLGWVFVNGYGISGTVVAANERWTVVQETMGRRTAVPTSDCERVLS